MGKFLTDLVVKQSVKDDGENVAEGRGFWTLVQPLIYVADSGHKFTVPVGFKTDFASIPRIPLVFEALGDRANLAACLHDFLYTPPHAGVARETADGLLREAALAQGVSKWVADALYAGVQAFGQSHWGE
jgi:hypothetical protein